MQRLTVHPTNLPGRAQNPSHGQALEESIDILVPKSGITHPTLRMIKIYPKRRLFNNKIDLFLHGVWLQGFALEHTIIFANDECVMGT